MSILNVKQKLNKIAKITLVITTIIVFPFLIKTTCHSINELSFKDAMEKSAKLMQEGMKNSKKEAEKKIKDEIVNKGYDYQLTMQSYNDQPDPYAGVDYNSLIIACATAKEKSNTLSKSSAYALPFYTATLVSSETSQSIPLAVDSYKKSEFGNYFEKSGKTYIDIPTRIDTYKMLVPGQYEKSGYKTVNPKQENIVYGDVTLKGLTSEDIFKFYGLGDNEEVKQEYQKKLAQAELLISGKGLGQTVNFSLPSYDTAAEKEIIDNLGDNVSNKRKTIVSVASALIGRVPYEWGGKSSQAGYDTSWWIIDSNGQQKGLDCSGFVQWVFRTANIGAWQSYQSTSSILSNTTTISKADLQPGDLGLLNNGTGINHVGIYAGNGTWIHCSSGANTVVAEKTNMFTIFKEMPTGESNNCEPISIDETENEETCTIPVINVPSDTQEASLSQYSEDDIYLLAQLVYHEANTEGLNGWIGVAEVVKNRVNSPDFPSTIKEVVYQPGQFAGNDEIKDMKPTDEEIQVVKDVLSGNLSIFNNPNVLYFRNAKGSKEDWGNFKWTKEINHHEFYLGT